MLRSMITATNTLGQLQKQLDMIGNNMANIDTQGYKRTQTGFSELLNQQVNNAGLNDDPAGRSTALGVRPGVGAMLTGQTVYTQGSIKVTDRELDIALTKPGQFLQVEAGGEVQYTRDGALYLNPAENGQLQLVTAEGHAVLDGNQNPIFFDDTFENMKVTADGRLTAVPGNQFVQLGIVGVNQQSMLEKQGGNRYALNENAPNGTIEFLNLDQIGVQQGALEMSNVDLSKEMTELMVAQRSYQLNSKSITMGDQMLGLINSVR
ncbi:flagellar hook-basal body protein [Metabacillus idriensis]|uniref:flagellar hook-basal body protein n=1 Tax=Metabacillus idriensis TaxID=324768 RepID=UPI002812EC85|nr:flagellar hook-basal body protein [Metabacillus idriensis]MDR0138878.1 flagellar hook-basal body protein [Metabacillus idriensis]